METDTNVNIPQTHRADKLSTIMPYESIRLGNDTIDDIYHLLVILFDFTQDHNK